MGAISADSHSLETNRYTLSHLSKVVVSLDKMELMVQHIGERGTSARD